MLLHFPHARLIADVVTRAIAHGDKGRHGQTNLDPIELHPIAADVSRLFETLDAFHDCWAGKTNFVGDGLVAGSTVLSEDAKNLAIGCVELGFGCHLGGSLVDL